MKPQFETNDEEDFASLYEKSFTGMSTYKSGQVLETQVLSISKDTVFIQLNGKSEGLVAKDELTDKEGNLTVKVGDPLRVFFLRADHGEMLFTTKISGESAGPALLEQAFNQKIPVEGLVEKEIKGGFEIKIGEFRAFCPFSQMGQKRSDNAAEYIGKNMTFKIQEYKENGRKIVVSNRVIHEEARQENLEALKQSLKVGMVVKGTVKSLQDFGAFVDLNGVQALLPVSEIGRTRVADIKSVLQVGQEIEASILKIDWQNERISLSMKSLLADPWDLAASKYPEGSKHTGKVVRLTDFGAFVALEPGIDGLVHISELRVSNKYDNSNEISVKMGQTLSVKILSVDKNARRISLKLAASAEDDAATAKYLEGSGDDTAYNPFAALLKKK